MEGQWALKSQALTNLSVEQVVDCDGMQKPDTFVVVTYMRKINMKNNSFTFRAQADCGVYGGWPFLSFQYLMQQVKFNLFTLSYFI